MGGQEWVTPGGVRCEEEPWGRRRQGKGSRDGGGTSYLVIGFRAQPGSALQVILCCCRPYVVSEGIKPSRGRVFCCCPAGGECPGPYRLCKCKQHRGL